MNFDRDAFKANLFGEMDYLRSELPSLSANDPDSKVFSYLVAKMFDTLDENYFFYTDGPNDLGIDFYVQDGDNYRIYQCKSIDYDDNPDGKTFDETPVNELAAAIDYLIDGNRKASDEVRKLRGNYQLNVEAHSLTAFLAIEGRLSPSAFDRFQQIQDVYRNKGVEIRLIDENKLFKTWHELDELDKPQNITLSLSISENGLMRMNGWFCAVINVKSLLKGMERYGKGLFDLNVRANLKSSKVNAEIKKTISTAKGQRQFIHLNNGLVIICNNYVISSDSTSVKIKGAQVINGCQTLSTIWDYYFNATAEEKKQLEDNLQILAKVISNVEISKDGLLDEIIVASNNQNPMNERNLKSNSVEQRHIQASFYRDPLPKQLKYFYIRKDGELEAFLGGSKVREPKRSYFEIQGSTAKKVNRYRHIDNVSLAKMWWSWIGNGTAVNTGSVNYFAAPTYTHIFEERPTEEAWEQLGSPAFTFNSKMLESQSPTQYQFLLCMAVSSYLECRTKPANSRQFKRDCINRLVENKRLIPSYTQQDADKALADDRLFTHTSWLSQMSYVLTDVASFVLINKYGALTSEVCRKLLGFEDISYWLEHGMNRKYIDDAPMLKGLLARMYEFLELSAGAFFTFNKDAILLTNRPKMYLGRQESIKQIKEKCLEFNEDYSDYVQGLKPADTSFFDSFPSL